MKYFSILKKDRQVKITVTKDPTNRCQVLPFVEKYTNLLQSARRDNIKLRIMMDLRKLSFSATKIGIVTMLTSMFSDLKNLSEETICAMCIIVSHPAIHSLIKMGLRDNPDGVPCKAFITKDEAVKYLGKFRKDNDDLALNNFALNNDDLALNNNNALNTKNIDTIEIIL